MLYKTLKHKILLTNPIIYFKAYIRFANKIIPWFPKCYVYTKISVDVNFCYKHMDLLYMVKST